MARIDVESMGVAHAQVMAALHAEAFVRGWPADAFAGLLAQPGTSALLASAAAGEPAGMVLYRHAGAEAEILTIAVRPRLRRKGIARALLAAMREDLPPAVEEIFIEVAETNVAGRAFYDSLGFETVGRRTGYYRDRGTPDDALVMRLPLP